MSTKRFIILIITAMSVSACALIPDNPARVMGSGIIITEARQVDGFSSIDLQCSAIVTVKHGSAESVMVIAEDNIGLLIDTSVENHKLVINSRPGVSYSPTKPITVDITVTSLEAVTLSGSGDIQVSDITADTFSAQLSGSGNLTLLGIANTTHYSLPGSGNISADQLKAKNVTASIDGSGSITLYASDSLDAEINGSGDIRYSGNPITITQEVHGSGSIHD